MADNCKKPIWEGWHTRSCERKAVRDGYCMIHHPDTVKARQEKTEARWAAARAQEKGARNERARKTVWEFLDYMAMSLEPEVQDALRAALKTWEHEPVGVRIARSKSG